MHSLIALLITVCFIIPLPAYAYEIDKDNLQGTHEDLTRAAVDRSILRTTPLLSDLGIDATKTYKDSEGKSRKLLDLIPAGAAYEDNTPNFLRHFFDPTNNQGLSAYLVVSGTASPDYILDDDVCSSSPCAHSSFSWKAARGDFLDALTKPDQTAREKAWAHMFESLGHIVHHVEDMAQPQHVRNEPHDPFFKDCEGILALDCLRHGALYEAFTNRPEQRAFLSRYFSLLPPVYPQYPDKFTSARSFWKNGTNAAWGSGLAEFSNHNFVGAHTEFGNDTYAEPRLSGESEVSLAQLCQEHDVPVCGAFLFQLLNLSVVTFGHNDVADRLTNSSVTNTRASTYSIFDADLTNAGLLKIWTLNRFNFLEAHKFLMPRAVSYSAGLINFFFRGKIDMVADPNASGNVIIKNLGPDDLSGIFMVYYDAADGTRKLVPQATWTKNIRANGATESLAFTPPTDPSPSARDQYFLVFTGTMGTEDDGVAGKRLTTQPPEPVSAVLEVNATEPGWNGLPATIELTDLTATAPNGRTYTPTLFQIYGTGNTGCPDGERGAPTFSAQADLDASFFAARSSANVPYTAFFPNRRPCSSFVAFKGLGDPRTEEVWINGTARAVSFGSATADWEYQVRFYTGDPANGFAGRKCEVGVVPNSGNWAPHFNTSSCTHKILF